jgi:hypothetical protein
LEAGDLVGAVGFQLKERPDRLPEGARLQAVPLTLFATLECNLVDDTSGDRPSEIVRKK